MKNSFARYHPVTVMSYFLCTLILTLFIRNPYMLAVGLVLSCAQFVNMRGKDGLRSIPYILGFIIIFTLIYAHVNPDGHTLLFMTFTARPFTFEAVIYGLVLGTMLSIVAYLFSVYIKYLTIERMLFLFSWLPPSAAMAISQISRFVPSRQKRIKTIYETRVCMGMGARNGVVMRSIKGFSMVVLGLTKWRDRGYDQRRKIMRCRGFGTTKRSSFAHYEFFPRDLVVVVFTALLTCVAAFGLVTGSLQTQYFPTFAWPSMSAQALVSIIAYGLLLIIPLVVNIKGRITWQLYVSKI